MIKTPAPSATGSRATLGASRPSAWALRSSSQCGSFLLAGKATASDKDAALKELQDMKARMAANLEDKQKTWVEEARQAGAQVNAVQVADDPITLICADTYDAAVSRTDKVVLVDCFASWCGPCKLIYPQVAELAREYDDELVVHKFDCNMENKAKAKELGIRVLPTFFLYKGGQKFGEMTGAKVEELRGLVEGALRSD